MIKKLRIKFILAAIAAVIFVLAVILGSINFVNYRRVIQDADRMLDVLADHNGRFPKKKKEREGFSPEAPYETRYFTVETGETGEILRVNTGKIAAVDKKEAETYAAKALKRTGSGGFILDYRYRKVENGDTVLLIFLDCGRNLANCRSFLAASILVSVLGAAAVLLLVVFSSKRIVRPFAENYEKQRRFITDAGHEIKTPLTIIDSDVAVLELESGENEWLRDILKQTERLRRLTDDLIYLARMEERKDQFQRILFPVSDVALETAASFQAIAKAKNKSFYCDIQKEQSCCGSQEYIRRLFSVLLDNAMKYSDENGTIRFTLKRKGRNILVSVWNTVEYIDPAQVPHLFDRFYRTDSSRSSGTGGYGIGLAIARAVVTAHKGKITAVSEDGKSLEILVTL